MRPFLLLSIRAEQAAVDEEYAAFARFLEVDPADLVRLQLGVEELPITGAADLDHWSGIVLGGGAFTYSDPAPSKRPAQVRAESDLSALLDLVVAADFPFLGACYGIGTLGSHQGGTVDRAHPEAVGPLAVTLTEHGQRDRVFADLPSDFAAYGGHKEALSALPPNATHLATSKDCPVQAFRIGRNVYATQFHPELDLAGLLTRIEVYATFGYFEPEEAELLRERSRRVEVSAPMQICRNFARIHSRT